MTPAEFSARLPSLTCNPLPAKPPFVFSGLSSRIFPLRASLDALQRFCNGYLNFVPESVGRFRASLPYVYLAVLDYGQVGEASGLGWFSQVEVFFAVPLEWYQRVDGRWVFRDFATITPFIFVDDSFSVPLGRTISGFPKVLARLTSSPNAWISDSQAPVSLARVETDVFPGAYSGREIERRVFLEVERAAPMSALRMPVDPNHPAAPWSVASHLAGAAAGFGRDAQWLAQAMRISQLNPLSQPDLLQGMLARLAPGLLPSGPGMVTHSINLKQFRRTDRPDLLCYQALTDGPMTTDAFKAGGLLGEERLLLGDVSGGHTIRLHEYPTLPIVQQLGLEVHRRWRDGDVGVAELKPVVPLWMEADVSLQPGVNLAWRGDGGTWRDGAGQPLPPDAAVPAAPAEPPRFNTMVASALEAVTGPFEFDGTTMHVLPLLARRDRLQTYLDNLVNQPLQDPVMRADGSGTEQVRLQVWSRPQDPGSEQGELAHVYLSATNLGRVTSESNDIGDWAKYELAFMIPVRWQRRTGTDANGQESWITEGVGVVPAYFFVDDCKAAITRHEFQGIDARTARFERPDSTWLDEGSREGAARQVLLRVEAETWAALDAGQQALIHPVIEIVRNEPQAGLGRGEIRDTAFEWARTLRSELLDKKQTARDQAEDFRAARTLALELLANRTPLSMYSLKQFRDVVDPDKACYQALVRVPRAIQELNDLTEIEETLVVRIHDYPKLDIVRTLGLIGVRDSSAGPGIVYNVQAIRPFTLRAKLSEALSERLMFRTGTRIWTLEDTAFGGRMGTRSPEAATIRVHPGDEKVQDRIDPSNMAVVMAVSRARSKNTAPISRETARSATGLIDPQMVLESVLSREWGSRRSDARWRQGRTALQRAIDRLPQGAELHNHALVEVCRHTLEPSLQRRGAPPLHAEKLFEMLEEITKARRGFERAYSSFEHSLTPSAASTSPDPEHRQALTLALRQAVSLKMPEALAAVGRVEHFLDHLYSLTEMLEQDKRHPLSIERLREAVSEARQWCDAIQDAVCDALSRAYQKPDFCIHRTAVGDQRTQLLATEWCWNEHWYWGRDLPKVTTAAAPHGKGSKS
jgi:hypothetical protein